MTYKIPLFDLNFDTGEEAAVIETLRSKWISMGPKISEFEERFSQMLQTEYAVALSNCTVALHLAMKLLDIKPGDEVICPSLTFVATVNAIRYVDAIPVFADIKSFDDLTIDPDDIESKITKKTKAIVVMHYGGFACDMDSIMSIANEHGLKVIEDACHGPLSEYKSKKLGTIGDVGCFSFFSNKNISTGEGGMLITNNPGYFEKAKLLRSHGMTSLSYERAKGHSTSYDVIDLGYNYRMDDIRAAIGIVQLSKLKSDLSKRAELRSYYLEKLEGLKNIIIPFKKQKYLSSNYIFTVLLSNSSRNIRDRIRGEFAEAGIQTSVHYPAVHRFSIYQLYASKLPKTDYASDNLITLPLFSTLETSQIDFIVSNLRKFANA
ncbi:MAG TPA: DegT/DnrJ/EryC1/StrS family aminotransferase [bacterium]|nr:DegT/DnrJ/EryC1/StrS family aminotransferase [bacterium]HQJ64438.1 DegT/DnrJ/EryC1/StrS family aminotransferase [bacterium]